MSKLILATILVFAVTAGPIFAEGTTQSGGQTQAFVDLDGDGFDDALEDGNGDGIPDEVVKPREPEQPANTIDDNMFASVQFIKGSPLVFLHNSGTFNHLKRQLTALVQHRGGFSIGAEFGPGSDIGSGAVLGGACAGGACTPH